MRTLLVKKSTHFMLSECSKNKKRFLKFFAVIIAVFWSLFLIATVFTVLEKKYVYPLLYKEEITAAAKTYDLDSAFLFGVVKTESGFNANAVSGKGAVGLMQITPSTAEYIAKRRGIAEYDLLDAATNLDFGAYYLKYLSEKFCGITEVAAAYNAGEGTVKNWLKNKEYSIDGRTLKAIPYGETAVYVKKICKSLKRYKKLYGKLLDK
ncbi:MAG: lytic transglycosylase domain-containing protein [Clostridia bacterium]|nr:lytic transglycosylase domain-containing protein [Clostridia bacterium]